MTEPGPLPEEWRVVKLGEVVELRKGTVSPAEVPEARYVRLEHIDSGEIRIRRFGKASDTRSAKAIFHAGDILYGKLRPYLDKAALAEWDGVCSKDILVLISTEAVDRTFAAYLMHTDFVLHHAIATTTGVNHPRTSWKSLSQATIPLPPLSEQQEIARILKAVDARIEAGDAQSCPRHRMHRGQRRGDAPHTASPLQQPKTKWRRAMSNLLFRKVDYTVSKLLSDIDMGEIGLPDIQRPFVWDTTRVRDLFDSMYRGYPIGTLLFWENGFPGEHRAIGTGDKQKTPRLLIVDGQQRLTALYAVMKGKPIVDKNFAPRRLRIAFHPLEERFEVTNTAIERNVFWISDISMLWQPDTDLFAFIAEFLERIKQRHKLDPNDEKRIPQAIQKLVNLANYPMTALEISAEASEEQVSEIFVRINSRGRTLNQADFILTLMSVFWDEGRKELEDFCRRAKQPTGDHKPSPYNPYFQPSPDQLLRVDVALGFRRARLEHVYSILRGKDLQTGEFSTERRDAQFARLKEAQDAVINLQHWHDFFGVLKRAGYIHPKMITSQTAVVYTYALWLIGKQDFGLSVHPLRDLMARWFFMSSLTGRYTSSPETRMEQDLALLRGCKHGEDFIRVLEREIRAVLTNDYWETTLPNELATASSRNTAQFAYFAALCLLDAPVLYSRMKVRDFLDPMVRGKRASIERHHLFPRRYLKKMGRDWRDINQVANYALVEWHDNVDISDRPPAEYAPEYEARFQPDELAEMYWFHTLPEKWYSMEYDRFLEERRKRMAAIIREGFMKI